MGSNVKKPPFHEMAERLIMVRKKSKLSQKKFAEICGTTQPNISNSEKGHVDVGKEVAIKMHRVLGLNLNWWYTGHGQPYLIDGKIKQTKPNERTAQVIEYLALKEETIDNLQARIKTLERENKLLRGMKTV